MQSDCDRADQGVYYAQELQVVLCACACVRVCVRACMGVYVQLVGVHPGPVGYLDQQYALE